MTRIELIEFLGDFLTRLDVFIGSMLPSNPNRVPFEEARDELDGMLLDLRKHHFNDKTQLYLNATEVLEAINDDLRNTIDDLTKTVETLDTITRFVGAVDRIIQIVIP
jgi:hypothetical protein